MTVFNKMVRYKGFGDNKPSDVFLFKKNLRFYLSLWRSIEYGFI